MGPLLQTKMASLLLRFAMFISAFCTILPATVDSSLTRDTASVSPQDRMAQVKAAMKEYTAGERRQLYSNDWVVEVRGGETEAEQVAAAHGFVNMGQVQ